MHGQGQCLELGPHGRMSPSYALVPHSKPFLVLAPMRLGVDI